MVSGVGRWPNPGQWVLRLASQGSSGKCCLTPKRNCQDMMVPLLPLDVTQSQMSSMAAAILTPAWWCIMLRMEQAERKMKLGPWWHANVVLLLEPVWVGFLLLASRKQAIINVVLCLKCLLKVNVKWKFKLEICGNKGGHTCFYFYPGGRGRGCRNLLILISLELVPTVGVKLTSFPFLQVRIKITRV